MTQERHFRLKRKEKKLDAIIDKKNAMVGEAKSFSPTNNKLIRNKKELPHLPPKKKVQNRKGICPFQWTKYSLSPSHLKIVCCLFELVTASEGASFLRWPQGILEERKNWSTSSSQFRYYKNENYLNIILLELGTCNFSGSL